MPATAADGAPQETSAPVDPPQPKQKEAADQAPDKESGSTTAAFTIRDQQPDLVARPLTREARASRKRMKNLILWATCAMVLVIVLWLLMVRGPLTDSL